MAEKWICFYDVKYYEEITYVYRHNKGLVYAESMGEVMDYLENYFGKDTIDEVNLRWAGQKGKECKQELNFTESEFGRFNWIQKFIEDDKSYEDYCRMEAEQKGAREATYAGSKQN